MKNPLRRFGNMVENNDLTPRNMLSLLVVALTLIALAVAALVGLIHVVESLGPWALSTFFTAGVITLIVWSFVHFWKVTDDE